MKNNMLIAALIVSLVSINAHALFRETAGALADAGADVVNDAAITADDIVEGPYDGPYEGPDGVYYEGRPRGIFGRRRAGYYRGGYDRDDYRDGGYYRR